MDENGSWGYAARCFLYDLLNVILVETFGEDVYAWVLGGDFCVWMIEPAYCVWVLEPTSFEWLMCGPIVDQTLHIHLECQSGGVDSRQ